MNVLPNRPKGKLRAGLVGIGLIAGKKHIPAFLKEGAGVDLVALCDLNLAAAQDAAKRFGISRAYEDPAEMLSAEKLDVVDICTPPATHASLAVESMKSGCHVLIEKPMALTVSDCDKIVEASRMYGVKVCVAHSDLFYRPFMRARELVAAGKVGEFRGMRMFLSTPTDYMTSHEKHWVHKLPGGVVGETGPHVVYLSLAFINPIRDVSVKAVKLLDYPWSRYEDYRIDLIGDNGISSATLSYATDQWMARLEVLGSKGILMLDLEGGCVIRYRRRELKSLPISLSLLGESAQIVSSLGLNALRFVTGRLDSAHDVLVSRFVDSILDGSEPPVTVEEGREAVRVTNMIVEKLSENIEGREIDTDPGPPREEPGREEAVQIQRNLTSTRAREYGPVAESGRPTPLTVVVLTQDEERNLPDCLASVVDWAREIFVVDSGSTDRTREIAAQYGAVVVEHPFETHAKQWNWALQNLPIATEWIFALDADQRVTPELREEISHLFRGGGGVGEEAGHTLKPGRASLDGNDGFYIKRRQIFRGNWIKHGGYYPKYLLKLLRRERSWSDEGEIADHRFYVARKSAFLRSDLIEDNQNESDILVWMKKHVVYADRQAKEEFLRRQKNLGWSARPSLFGTPDQRILWFKRFWYRMPIYIRPFIYFFYRYFFRLGFLDGRQGLLFHFLQAFWYRIMVDVVLDDLRRYHQERTGRAPSSIAGPVEDRRRSK